jgi:hypothetical protein
VKTCEHGWSESHRILTGATPWGFTYADCAGRWRMSEPTCERCERHPVVTIFRGEGLVFRYCPQHDPIRGRRDR